MFARKIRVLYEENGQRLPCPMKWMDSFAMRNFTNVKAYDDTLPVADGLMEIGNSVAIPELRERIDLKVFIDTPADLRILRRMVRDVNERRRTADAVMEQYLATVRPMHDRFVEPSKRFADVVIPWELHNEPAVALLAARVREHAPDEDVTGKAV